MEGLGIGLVEGERGKEEKRELSREEMVERRQGREKVRSERGGNMGEGLRQL